MPRQGLSLNEPQGESLPVTVYACGPTVYAPVHLGNWRTFILADWLTRTLTYLGYEVKLVMNITDVDDKTISGASGARVPLAEFTKKYEQLFIADREALNILPPAASPHATEFVPAMIELIEILMAKGLAYRAEDGVYFLINKSENYGKLAGNFDPEGDFVLWKFWKEEDGDVAWDSPFGRGRPGWHLECSAMIKETLGETIDIHLGGSDLIFPHHTNEIAQSEGANGAPLAKFWLHGGFLNIAEEKMSKSLGNIFTLADLKARVALDSRATLAPLSYRYFLLSTHYRKIANFTWEALEGAQTAYQKLLNTVADWQGLSLNEPQGESLPVADETPRGFPSWDERFRNCLEADLNFPQALALVWELVKDEGIAPGEKLATLLKWDEVLGLNLAAATKTEPIPENVQKLIAERELARQSANFPRADELRDKIAKLGFMVEDKTDGPRVRKA